ncbi:unnamed protein product [Gordionus sp. m RMFG-2023]|uniref:BOS complex subunit NOMO1-like isoform X2 n=1 Tax=Gordionus sp. m RMFG-2023 TaxID=3053472 RepID=UPI0030E5288F
MFILLCLISLPLINNAHIIACSGYIKSNVSEISWASIKVHLFKYGALKGQAELSPHNNLYIIPIYENGTYTIKLDVPGNWNFYPSEYNILIDGVTDQCTKGENLNFDFAGFYLSDRIYTFPKLKGPSGVHIELRDKIMNNLIMNTITDNEGMYHFSKPILPGNYKINALHDHWQFIQSQILINLTKDGNIEKLIGEDILVTGYLIKAKILLINGPGLDPNQPTKQNGFRVNFYLFTIDNQVTCERVKCQQDYGYEVNQEDSDTIITDSQNIAKNIISKTLYPNNTKVRQDNFKLCKQCHSDTLTGQVGYSNVIPGRYRMTAPVAKNGLPNVKLELFGLKNFEVITDTLGKYVIDGVKSGHYQLKLTKDHYYFPSDLKIYVSPNNAILQDIYPESYDVCGRFDKELMDATEKLPPFERIKILFSEQNNKNVKEEINPRAQGTFCVPLKPGTYDIEISLPNEEAFSGIKYAANPPYIRVKNNPILGLVFKRYYVSIQGRIHCIDDCAFQNLTLHLYRITSGHDHQENLLRSTQPTNMNNIDENIITRFSFDSLPPGPTYNVCVEEFNHDVLCWLDNKYCKELSYHQTYGYPPIDLYQIGRKIRIKPRFDDNKLDDKRKFATFPVRIFGQQNATKVNEDTRIKCVNVFGYEKKDGEADESTMDITCELEAKEQSLCLPVKEKLHIQPQTCTLFSFTTNELQKSYAIDTSNLNDLAIDTPALHKAYTGPILIEFEPVRYKLSVGINILTNYRMRKGYKIARICLIPLITPANGNGQDPFFCEDVIYKSDIVIEVPNKPNRMIHKTFNVDIIKHPKLEVTIQSEEYLFRQLSYSFTFNVEEMEKDCKNKIVFEMLPSLFIGGKIYPSTTGIKIDLISEIDKSILNTTYTDDNGSYLLGPISDGINYEIIPSKDGFNFLSRSTFTQDIDPNGVSHSFKTIYRDFDISKISKLIIQIFIKEDPIQSNATPLSNVLISLSGVKDRNYKSFNSTGQNGTLTFIGLAPGQYYILPIMKEFDFEPTSQLITLQEKGEPLHIRILAIKSAFSCRGIVTSLNGQPLTTLSTVPRASISTSQLAHSTYDSDMLTTPGANNELHMEAIGIEHNENDNLNYNKRKCSLLKEDGTISKSSGHFEVKALVPGCTYILTLNVLSQEILKIHRGNGSHILADIILKSIPSHYIISVPSNQKEDLPGFYRFRVMTPSISDSLLKVESHFYGKVNIFVEDRVIDRNAPIPPLVILRSSYTGRTDYKLLDHFKISLYLSASSTVFDETLIQTKHLNSRSEFFSFDPIPMDYQKYTIKLESTSGLDGNLYQLPIVSKLSFTADLSSRFLSFDVFVKPKHQSNYEQVTFNDSSSLDEENYQEDTGKTPSLSNKSSLKEMALFCVFLLSLIIMIYGHERFINFFRNFLVPTLEYMLNKSTSTFKLSPVSSRNNFSESSSDTYINQDINSDALWGDSWRKKGKVKKT